MRARNGETGARQNRPRERKTRITGPRTQRIKVRCPDNKSQQDKQLSEPLGPQPRLPERSSHRGPG